MAQKKRIGVLTSGGDCSGLNAAIRAVVLRADELGWEVYGINDGTGGLLERPMKYKHLKANSILETISMEGGSYLRSINKGDPFAFPMPDGTKKDRVDEIAAGAKELGLSALITIGGDGSMDIVGRICDRSGLDFIGIPKTIDGDAPFSEAMIGFDTAIRQVVDAIDATRTTAASHNRCIVTETMGRGAGHLALHAGLAAGADVILLPEQEYDFDKVKAKLEDVAQKRNYAVVVVAEAAQEKHSEQKVIGHNIDGTPVFGGAARTLADRIVESGAWGDTRYQALGHTQRGGKPTQTDRLYGAIFGVAAVDLINEGKTNRMVCIRNGKLDSVSLEEVLNIKEYPNVKLDTDLYFNTAKRLGICLG